MVCVIAYQSVLEAVCQTLSVVFLSSEDIKAQAPSTGDDFVRIGLPVTSPPLPPNKPKVVTPEPSETGPHVR